MKILYVEDQLEQNLPRIINLFENCLEKEILKKLQEIENDDYGVDIAEVERILDESLVLEVEWSFPKALEKVLTEKDGYSLFIVDRNLSERRYTLEELQKVEPNFDETKLNKFDSREGDYLLTKLVYEENVLDKFYFLTANLDEMRGFEEIQNHIDAGKFRRENFVEKGKMESLKKIIDNFEIFKIQMANLEYLKILKENINNKTKDRFLRLLEDSEKPENFIQNLTLMRNILEKIMKQVSRKTTVPSDCFRNDELKMQTFFHWLFDEKEFGYNSLLKYFSFSIFKTSSEFGVHEQLLNLTYQPTTNTVNSLIFALKEIILWFGEVCEQENKF